MLFSSNKIEPKCKACKGQGFLASGGGTASLHSAVYGCRIDTCGWCNGTGKRREMLIPVDPALAETLKKFKESI